MLATARFSFVVLLGRNLRLASTSFVLVLNISPRLVIWVKLLFSEATETEIERLEEMVGKKFTSSRVWAPSRFAPTLFCGRVDLRVQEYRGDIFDGPFSRS